MTDPRPVLALLMVIAVAWPLAAQPERAGVSVKYLGTAGWEITDGRSVVLIDPYLSRLRRVTPNDTPDPADTRPLFDNTAVAQSDATTIDRYIERADFILITHTHYDHVLDAPYIARRTGATILGTEYVQLRTGQAVRGVGDSPPLPETTLKLRLPATPTS